MSFEDVTTAKERAVARELAEEMRPRRRPRPDGAMNQFMRSGRQTLREAEEARIKAKVAKAPVVSEADDLRKLREQADADREAAASARRRAEAANRRVA